MKTAKQNDTVTIPRWLYENMRMDCDLVKHLTHYRGFGWIEAVKKEMNFDKKYSQGAFKKDGELITISKPLQLKYKE